MKRCNKQINVNMCIKISQYSSIIISKKDVFQRTTFIISIDIYFIILHLFISQDFKFLMPHLFLSSVFPSLKCKSGGLVILQIQTNTTAPVTLLGN